MIPDPDESLGWMVKQTVLLPSIEVSPELKARADREWGEL